MAIKPHMPRRNSFGVSVLEGEMDIADTVRRPPQRSAKALLRRASRAWLPGAGLISAVVLWEAVARFSGLPQFILPAPSVVAERLLRAISDGSLTRHSAVTLSEVLAGLALGLVGATLLGYALAKSETLERLLSPYVVASQSIPIVAVAPLLVIWFGPGRLSKVLILLLDKTAVPIYSICHFHLLRFQRSQIQAIPTDLWPNLLGGALPLEVSFLLPWCERRWRQWSLKLCSIDF